MISIEENRPTSGDGSRRPAAMPAENEKEAGAADEEAHHIEDNEEDDDQNDGEDEAP
jgi:hypothetical protein